MGDFGSEEKLTSHSKPSVSLGRNRANAVSPRISWYRRDRDLTPQFTSLLIHLTYSFGKCHSWLTPFALSSDNATRPFVADTFSYLWDAVEVIDFSRKHTANVSDCHGASISVSSDSVGTLRADHRPDHRDNAP